MIKINAFYTANWNVFHAIHMYRSPQRPPPPAPVCCVTFTRCSQNRPVFPGAITVDTCILPTLRRTLPSSPPPPPTPHLTAWSHVECFLLPSRVASEISRNEISRNVSRNFYFAFREIFLWLSRNFAKQNIWKFHEISRKWSYKTVQKRILTRFYSLILIESEFQLNSSWFCKQIMLWR